MPRARTASPCTCGDPAIAHRGGDGPCLVPGCVCIRYSAAKRGHKFGAKRTVVDGKAFDSRSESTRHGELLLLEKAGKIADLEHQVAIELHAPSADPLLPAAARVIGVYRADFRYRDLERGGQLVIEDNKGKRYAQRGRPRRTLTTPLYRWKRRHLEIEYGIAILET